MLPIIHLQYHKRIKSTIFMLLLVPIANYMKLCCYAGQFPSKIEIEIIFHWFVKWVLQGSCSSQRLWWELYPDEIVLQPLCPTFPLFH